MTHVRQSHSCGDRRPQLSGRAKLDSLSGACSKGFGRSPAIPALLLLIALTSACRIDMHVQPRENPLSRSDFFTDQRSARPLVEGTVARGQLHEDTYFYTGKIGGKPAHAWPAFIVITFEMTILFAGISAVFGMLALNGLPMPYHPVFNVPRFSSASKDRFFLIVFSSDKKYHAVETRRFLEGLAPKSVSEVPS